MAEEQPYFQYQDATGAVQGPYDLVTMAAWSFAGYIPGETLVRTVDAGGGCSSWQAADLTPQLYLYAAATAAAGGEAAAAESGDGDAAAAEQQQSYGATMAFNARTGRFDANGEQSGDRFNDMYGHKDKRQLEAHFDVGAWLVSQRACGDAAGGDRRGGQPRRGPGGGRGREMTEPAWLTEKKKFERQFGSDD